MLHDQDLIGQFIQYMTSKDRGHLVKFWLDSENFSEASFSRIRVHSIHSAIENESTTTLNHVTPQDTAPELTSHKLQVSDDNSNTTSLPKSKHSRQESLDLQERE